MQYVRLLQDSMFKHRLRTISYQTNIDAPFDTTWQINKFVSVSSFYEGNMKTGIYHSGIYTVVVSDSKRKIETTYLLRGSGVIDIYQQLYIVNDRGLNSASCAIGSTYQVGTRGEVNLVENYDTIYPICWKEALNLALNTGYLSRRHIKWVGIGYPKNGVSLRQMRSDTTNLWSIAAANRYVKVNPFTGKIVEKGYYERNGIQQEDGSYSDVIKSIKIKSKK